jgi:hypothetical protein
MTAMMIGMRPGASAQAGQVTGKLLLVTCNLLVVTGTVAARVTSPRDSEPMMIMIRVILPRAGGSARARSPPTRMPSVAWAATPVTARPGDRLSLRLSSVALK